jgi:microcystin-dependent protein
MPDLAAVEAIASDTPARTVTLSGISVAVLLSCLDAANRWYDWFIDEKQVSYSQYADILGYLSLARTELLTMQIGEIKVTASGIIPTGCLLCDGSTYDKADYPALYDALAPAFILGFDTFFVPDLREKFISGAMVSGNVGDQGGEAEHTLIVSELPSHSHTIPLTATTLALEPGEVTVTTPIPILTANTGDTGGGDPHNNIPPYLSLLYYVVAL